MSVKPSYDSSRFREPYLLASMELMLTAKRPSCFTMCWTPPARSDVGEKCRAELTFHIED